MEAGYYPVAILGSAILGYLLLFIVSYSFVALAVFSVMATGMGFRHAGPVGTV